jgi:nanoRNase/pAp phosphatase (c-di-AMP/oligoRNAs hydrolase)
VFLSFHSIGDTDAVASAIVLSGYFSGSTVATPDIITTNAKRELHRLDYEEGIISNKFEGDADLVVLIDVNNFEECGAFAEKLKVFDKDILIVDHHLMSELPEENVYVFNEESFSATASIIYELVRKAGIGIGEREAKLLLMGIISDSAELKNSTPETFREIGALLDIARTNYASIQQLMAHVEGPDARADAIRDLFTSSLLIKGGLLIVYGEARAHANLAADAQARGTGIHGTVHQRIHQKN